MVHVATLQCSLWILWSLHQQQHGEHSLAKLLRSWAVGEISLPETSHKNPPARSSDGAGVVLPLYSSEMLVRARRSCRTRETFAYGAWCLAVWCPAYRKRKGQARFDQYKERKKMALLDTEGGRDRNISGLRLDMEEGKKWELLRTEARHRGR